MLSCLDPRWVALSRLYTVIRDLDVLASNLANLSSDLGRAVFAYGDCFSSAGMRSARTTLRCLRRCRRSLVVSSPMLPDGTRPSPRLLLQGVNSSVAARYPCLWCSWLMCFICCRFPGKGVGVNLPGAGSAPAAAAPVAEVAKVCCSHPPFILPLVSINLWWLSNWVSLLYLIYYCMLYWIIHCGYSRCIIHWLTW